jgi:hypothetical protein
MIEEQQQILEARVGTISKESRSCTHGQICFGRYIALKSRTRASSHRTINRELVLGGTEVAAWPLDGELRQWSNCSRYGRRCKPLILTLGWRHCSRIGLGIRKMQRNSRSEHFYLSTNCFACPRKRELVEVGSDIYSSRGVGGHCSSLVHVGQKTRRLRPSRVISFGFPSLNPDRPSSPDMSAMDFTEATEQLTLVCTSILMVYLTKLVCLMSPSMTVCHCPGDVLYY